MSFDWESLKFSPKDRKYERRKATKQFRWYMYADGRTELQQMFRVAVYEHAPYTYRDDHCVRVYDDWVVIPTEREEIPL